MNKQKKTILITRFIASFLFSLIIVYLILVAVGFYKIEYQKKPIIKEKVEKQDVNYLYNFYVKGNPNINDVLYLGGGYITFIVYLDYTSNISFEFMNDIFPKLKKDYIDNGKIRFFHKPYITTDDIDKKDKNYQVAMFFDCIKNIDGGSYYTYLIKFYKDRTLNYTNKSNIEELKSCMYGKPTHTILEAASEYENFGMAGIMPRIYIGIMGRENTIIEGIPKYTTFQRRIRDHQLILGD